MAEGGRLSLGVLPAASHDNRLSTCITRAITDVRSHYPTLSLSIQEAPNATLQGWTMQGVVGLAIVDAALTQMPRLTLSAPEELAVIVDPRHALLPPGPVRLASLATLKLALPTRAFGLRQLVDTAARSVGLDLKPHHEIDSTPMLIQLLSLERIATILPRSAVASELMHNDLEAHAIIEPAFERRLFALYSGDRSLTIVERTFVARLREHLITAETSAERPISLTSRSA